MNQKTNSFMKQAGDGPARIRGTDPQDALLSVVTVFGDRANRFERTFQHITNQTFPWFEWIIVDVGTAEESLHDGLLRLAQIDRRIRIVECQGQEPEAFGRTCCKTDCVFSVAADAVPDATVLECFYWCQYYRPGTTWRYTEDFRFQADPVPAYDTQKQYNYCEFTPWDRKVYKADDRKRMLWLIPWMVMGGGDKFNLDAITGLKEQGIDSFILATDMLEDTWRDRFAKQTDEIFKLHDFLDPSDYLKFVSYYIQSREIDILFVSDSYIGYYMIPWLRQHFPDLVIVDYVHNTIPYWRNGGYSRASGNISGIIEKTYVCNSLTNEEMSKLFGRNPESVESLYIGVDHQFFARENEKPGYLHERLGLPEDRPIVLFPCRISPEKRPMMMLEIAQKVRARIPNAVFAVCGYGVGMEELQRGVKDRALEDTVYFVGEEKDMRACYRDSKLVLICSFMEGLTLTAYEALSMGVPVVSGDVGGQRDLIDDEVGALIPFLQEAGYHGDMTLYPPEEVQLFADAVCGLLEDEDLWKRKSENCRRRIENGFGIGHMIRELNAKLRVLCEDPVRIRSRREVSEILCRFHNFASDYYSCFVRWEYGLQEMQKWVDEVVKGKDWLEEQYHRMTAENRKLQNWSTEQEEGKQWLQQQNENLTKELTQIQSWCKDLEADKQWLQQQKEDLTKEFARIQSWCKDLETDKQWLQQQNKNLTKELTQIQSWCKDLEADKQWLQQQNDTLTKDVSQMQTWCAGLEDAKQWLQQQVESLTVELKTLRGWTEELETAKEWVEGQWKRAKDENDELMEQLAALRRENNELKNNLHNMTVSRDYMDHQLQQIPVFIRSMFLK